MAFNNSFTAVTGATYTAAQYNTHTRDNLTAIWVYTTVGDIAYATGAATLAKLALSNPYYVLGVNAAGNAPEWRGMFQRCDLSKNADQTFASGSTADVIWQVESDPLGWHAASAAEITPTVTGTYMPFVSLYFNKNTGGTGAFALEAKVLNNGAETPNKKSAYFEIDAVAKLINFGGIPMVITGGQSAKVTFQQSSGGDGKLIAGGDKCYFTLLRIG